MTLDIFAINSPEWMLTGLCAGRPEQETKQSRRAYGQEVDSKWHPTSTQEYAATRNCRGCPSAIPCLEFALADPELDGVWGGTTTEQRHRMRAGLPIADDMQASLFDDGEMSGAVA